MKADSKGRSSDSKVDPKTRSGTRVFDRPLLTRIAATELPLIVFVLLAAGENENFLAHTPAWLIITLLLGTGGLVTGVNLFLDNGPARQRHRLQRALRMVSTGDFSRQLRATEGGMLTPLVHEYNHMIANLSRLQDETNEYIRQADLSLHHQTDEMNALAVENSRLRAETQRQGKSVSTLQEFSRKVTETPGAERICGQLLQALESQVSFDTAYVILTEDTTPQGVPVAIIDRSRGLRLTGEGVKNLSTALALPGKDMVADVLKAESAVRAAAPDDGGDRGHHHLLGVPLPGKERVVGALIMLGSQPRPFSKQDERVSTALVDQAVLAIENIRLLEEAREVESLRELDRLKSELISTVSHELRTPLASIKGYLSTLLRPDASWDEATQAEFLQIAEEEADRLQALIDNLLQMSRIDAGMLHIDRQPVQLGRLAHKVARKARLHSPEHRVAVLFPGDMPDVAVDAVQIEQVLNNLVDNAIKYSPAGGRVTIRGEMFDGTAKVSVTDDGLGISTKHLERIFERFYRADTKDIKRTRGTGLGLSICRGIIEAHGGVISAESVLGHGSTFSFILPVEVTPTDELPVAEASGG